jgi:hypothetical protein
MAMRPVRAISSTPKGRSTQFHQVRPVLLVGGHFDESEVAFQHGAGSDVFGEKNVHEFFETRFETHRAALVGVGADGHARDFLVFRGANGERIDVDREAPGERSDAIQDTGLVFDVGDDSLHKLLNSIW